MRYSKYLQHASVKKFSWRDRQAFFESKRFEVYSTNFPSFIGLASAFEKRKWNAEVVDYGVPYDFASIMHYPFTAFSKNGKPTIRNIVDMQGKTPYVVLSDGDAQQTNAMYKCNSE